MNASVAVSLLALLVSAFLGYVQWKQGRRLSQIETDRRAEELAQRVVADVTAEFVRVEQRRVVLRITNRGPAPAAAIIATIPDYQLMRPMDAVRLVAIQVFDVPIIMSSATPGALRVSLTWEDERGPHQELLDLSVP